MVGLMWTTISKRGEEGAGECGARATEERQRGEQRQQITYSGVTPCGVALGRHNFNKEI